MQEVNSRIHESDVYPPWHCANAFKAEPKVLSSLRVRSLTRMDDKPRTVLEMAVRDQHPSTAFRFFDLPLELRNIVYTLSLVPNSPTSRCTALTKKGEGYHCNFTVSWNVMKALLLVSKQFEDEYQREGFRAMELCFSSKRIVRLPTIVPQSFPRVLLNRITKIDWTFKISNAKRLNCNVFAP